MRLRILISLMVISAASLLVIGGLAVFTGEGSGSGDVAAGTVTVTVGTNDPDFDDGVVDDSACDNVGPTNCDVTIVSKYTGTLAADITAITPTISMEEPSGCWTASVTAPALSHAVAPGDTDTIIVTMTLLDNNNCQGATADIDIGVTVTQS